MNLTESELDIIRILRQLVPYEEVRMSKSKDGQPDCYLVVRTQKILLNKSKSGAIAL